MREDIRITSGIADFITHLLLSEVNYHWPIDPAKFTNCLSGDKLFTEIIL